MIKINGFWFRRDLRLSDNAGLFHALKSGKRVLPVFIFDSNILTVLKNKKDPRVQFIHSTLQQLQSELHQMGSTLLIRYGKPEEVWNKLCDEYPFETVFTNRDYEPYAIQRDASVRQVLSTKGVGFQTNKDHVIFEGNEVLKDDGKPYTVFTPYSKKWIQKLDSRSGIREFSLSGPNQDSFFLKSYPTERYYGNFFPHSPSVMPSLVSMGFEPDGFEIPSANIQQGLIRNYANCRDFPAIAGTSRLGIHFRFGTISIREKARKARGLSSVFLNELIWRDFYSMILQCFPQVVGNAFRPEYDRIEWDNNPELFEKWCQGMTGYPLVDAGMRELNATGFMHNRVRMVTASFLTKHLLIDWRWGEAYFAEKLLDFDLASNNGGWQWAAGCGTDAAPYFRIFNPAAQLEKFDKDLIYTKKWVPELGTSTYPKPIIDHKIARERCLKVYKAALTSV